MTYYYQEATRNSPRCFITYLYHLGFLGGFARLHPRRSLVRRPTKQGDVACNICALNLPRLSKRSDYNLPVDRFLLTLTRFSLSDSPSSRHSTSSITSSSACFELENAFAATFGGYLGCVPAPQCSQSFGASLLSSAVANVATAFAPAYVACGSACAYFRCT
jgi:hypothetical protein